MIGRALTWWIDKIARLGWAVVIMALAVTAAALYYTASRLVINTDTADMIAPEVPFRRNNEAFAREFPQFRDTIVIVIDGAAPEDTAQASERLAAWLADQETVFRDVYYPSGDAFFQRNGLLYTDYDELTEFADRLAGAEPLLATLARDPSLRGLAEVIDLAIADADAGSAAQLAELFDAMATVATNLSGGRAGALSWERLFAGDDGIDARQLIVVQPVLDYGSFKPAAAALAAIRLAATDLDIGPAHGATLRLTGSVALDHEELESVELGGRTAGLLSLALVTVLLALCLRSVRLVIAVVATLLMGLVWTAAFATLAVGQLNLISVAFAVLFIGLGVDFGIHMALRFREELTRDGDRTAALGRAAHGVAGALTLSAAIAAAGFFAFLPTDYRGLAEFGLISGGGMFIALFASLSVLPALLALLRPPAAKSASAASRLGIAARSYARPILWGAACLGVASAAAVPWLRFDLNPLNLKDPRSESVMVFNDLADMPRTSPYTINVLAANGEQTEALAARLEALPEVDTALSLASFIPADQDDKLALIDEMAFFLAPVVSFAPPLPPPSAAERRVAFDQLVRLAADAEAALGPAGPRLHAALTELDGGEERLTPFEQRLFAHLPRALERLTVALSAGAVTLADLPVSLRQRWIAASGQARIELLPAGGARDNDALRRFAEAALVAAPTATGTPVIITEASKVVVRAFTEATLLAFVLITAILSIVLRRAADIALVLAPLALAAVLTAAAAVALGLALNFANIIVLPLLMGLGVASGIHLVLRRRQESDGARLLTTSTPRAVLFSTLTTVASFGSLALSGHRGMTSMGQLLTLALGFTLVAMLVVLPSLMARGDSRQRL